MKKIVAIFFTTTLIALFSLVSCEDNNEITNEKITLEVAASYVQFTAAGVGNITFDWGDETESETFVLSSINSYYSHQYYSDNKHTLTINGHITSFYSSSFYLDGNYATNQITTLDASKNSALKTLDCSENIITQIDVNQCTALTELECGNNWLATLNVNDNTALVKLRCQQNLLTHLDLSNNIKLSILSCNENKITQLDMNHNIKLKELYCEKNYFSYTELNKLFETLHADTINVKGKFIVVSGNPGSRFCTKEIAEKKGWTVYK